MEQKQYIVAGGGIAGLTLAYLLARAGRNVCVIEKSSYPRHKVCGEYVSNEVLPFLQAEDILPEELVLPEIRQFELSDTRGNQTTVPLDLGGFGISRHLLDHLLYRKAVAAGAEVKLKEKIHSISFNNEFSIETTSNSYISPWVIGAFGKRSEIDRLLNRPFMKVRSPYLGVKFHVTNPAVSRDTVSLHNFCGGYLGVNAVENNRINICYLAQSSLLKSSTKSLFAPDFVLSNPRIAELLASGSLASEKPEVINEISFATKLPVEQHLFMCGDAAGMITPLCGNGMAMAFRSARLLAKILLKYDAQNTEVRHAMETEYAAAWKHHFSSRLKTGRIVQGLFGSGALSSLAVTIGNHSKGTARWLMKQTHGRPFS